MITKSIMKNLAKLIVVSVFGLGALFMFLTSVDLSGIGSVVMAQVAPQATPTPVAANITANKPPAVNSNAATSTNTAKPPAAGDKKIQKNFTLGKESLSEYGEVPFDHDTHASAKYSPDGKSVVGCAECHHTDQPKSALKPPLVTSERDVTLTMASWQASPQKVSECRACHFQDGSVPDNKTMPTATYVDGGKSVVKDLNNELAYHINCNTCHDAAFAARPEVKKKPGFATSKDCMICHKPN